MSTRRWMQAVFAALLLAASLTFAACGSDDDDDSGSADTGTTEQAAAAIESNPDNAAVELTIGSKNFTEQKILGEIYAQALAAAGYTVDTQLNLGDEQTALKALEVNWQKE